jgi:hypothetical protein
MKQPQGEVAERTAQDEADGGGQQLPAFGVRGLGRQGLPRAQLQPMTEQKNSVDKIKIGPAGKNWSFAEIWFWPLLPVGATQVWLLRGMVGLGGPFTEHAPKPVP